LGLLIAGRPTFALPTLGTAAQASGKLVGEVKGFEPATHFESSQVLLLDRVSQFAIVAARQAVSQSGLALRGELAERTAAIIGTGSGGHTTVDESFHRLYAEGAARLHPLTIPKAMISARRARSRCIAASKVRFCGFICLRIGNACHRPGIPYGAKRHWTCAVTGGTEASITFGAMKG
jgi:nodulation protein E